MNIDLTAGDPQTHAVLSAFGPTGSAVRCEMTSGSISAWAVRLLNGRRVVASGRAGASGGNAGALTVRLKLTKQGRRLLARHLGGRVTSVVAAGSTSGGARSAQARTRAILGVEHFTTPAGSWLPNQAAPSPSGRRFLRGLRGKLIGVAAARCDGYTAKVAAEAPNAVRISSRRAAIVCAALKRLRIRGTTKAVGHGYSRPIASNDTRAGRARNRRVEVTITHTSTRL
jgi:hypothetical protein